MNTLLVKALCMAVSPVIGSFVVEARPHDVRIIRSIANGSGCVKAGNIRARVLPGGELLSLSIASIVSGFNARRIDRSNCNILVTVEHPSDWQFRVREHWVSYSAKIVKAVGVVAAKVHFQGQASTSSAQKVLSSSIDVSRQNMVLSPADHWTRCSSGEGRTSRYRTTVVLGFSTRLKGTRKLSDEGLRIDGPIETALQWRSCTE